MPRFEFVIGKGDEVREAGAVLTENFGDALRAIAEQAEVTEGETLAIGVAGFPPARYEFVIPFTGRGAWRPEVPRLAA